MGYFLLPWFPGVFCVFVKSVLDGEHDDYENFFVYIVSLTDRVITFVNMYACLIFRTPSSWYYFKKGQGVRTPSPWGDFGHSSLEFV